MRLFISFRKNDLRDAGFANTAPVRFSEFVRGKDNVSIYEVYIGPSRAAAVEFLNGRKISRKFYYVIVDTPEGSFGRDLTGFYRE